MSTILDQIGGTPLVRLARCVPSNGAEIWLKLELQNPTGSMKDRYALAMIEGAERDGLIGPDTTIVEYSGGSTGPALALVCSVKGYRCRIVISDSHTEERIQLMRALGAEVEIVPSVEGRPPRVSAEDIRRMAERSAELAMLPDHYATLQFTNPYVLPAVRDGLGREIWEQTKGRVTAFVQGVGTAGSLLGVAQALKPHGVRIYALEPAGSAAISGGPPGPFAVQGWSGMVPPRWDPEWVDEVERIEDHEAIEMTRRLSRKEGIFAGISTGANVVGAIRIAERLGPDAVVVTVAVDTGFKYMSVAPYGQPAYASGVLGRDEELAAVESFLAAAAAGSRTLVLEGEPGIGKTALWNAAVRGACERSYTVLASCPTEPRTGRSFGALIDLLASVPVGVLESLPSPQRRALETALRLREPTAPAANPSAIGLGAFGVLRALAASRPVVVAVDDAQWLDPASASALGFALRRLDGERVSILLARSADALFPFDLDGFVRLPLEPLSLGALHRLLQDRLETVFPRPQIVRIHRESGGNPFAALELAAAWNGIDEFQDLLLGLAALSDPRAGMFDRTELERAAAAGVIEIDGDRIRSAHPLLAQRAYKGASEARRRDVHRRLAALIEDPEERARHLARAADRPSEEAAAALEEAARHAAALGATAAAAELAEAAVRSTPGDDEGEAVVRRKLLAAETEITAGAPAAGRKLLEELVEELGPTRERATARLLLSTTRCDDLEAASALAARALIDAGDDQALRAAINSRLALLWHVRGDPQRALAHAQAACVAAETLGDARVLVRVLSLLGLVRDEEPLELALELESETERPSGCYSPRLVLGIRLLRAGRLDDARAALESDRANAVAFGDEAGLPLVLVQLAEVELRSGRWDAASRHARAAVELAAQFAVPHLHAAALAAHARVRAHLGELDEARAAASRGARLAADARAGLYAVENAAVLGFAELSARRPQQADRHLRPLLADAQAASRYGADAIEAMIESGAADEARRYAEAFDAHRCRGLLLAANAQLDEAEAALRTAVREHEASGEAFEHARSLLALGTVLRRERKKREAREALEAALARFEQLGATSWAVRARAELARIAGRRPGPNGLTPTEQRIAELVSEGLSNKEVAAALHVTVKTVEGSLSRIYDKLGVRSRSGLAGRFAAGGVTRTPT